MSLPINTFTDGVVNPTEITTLINSESFRLQSEHKTITIVNASTTEVADVVIKGTRDNIEIPFYGHLDIREGLSVVIQPLSVATITIQLMFKQIGENGDFITLSTDSIEKERVISWVTSE